ncbi:hypothetical protein [Streptomyces sp. NPDC001380]|uniref:hypothetical protein n=1 Tax=Streptomyces sp. NPDC001380 TaxID=3364566 RepID=UPI0036BABB3D
MEWTEDGEGLLMIESAEEFVRLRMSGDSADYQRLKQEEAPLDVWLDIVNNYPGMRFWVTFNRTVPDEALRFLVRDDDWRVRGKIAGRKGVPEDILDLLSRDEHDAVVSSVAGNPGTPINALLGLSRHHWGQVREKASRQLEERSKK